AAYSLLSGGTRPAGSLLPFPPAFPSSTAEITRLSPLQPSGPGAVHTNVISLWHLAEGERRRETSMIREKEFHGSPGFAMLFFWLLLILASVAGLIASARAATALGIVASVLLLVASIIALCGLFLVNPNEAKVLQLFGDYKGTARTPGLRWANPFYSKRKVSVRTRNFETGKLKVNDKSGNPIE